VLCAGTRPRTRSSRRLRRRVTTGTPREPWSPIWRCRRHVSVTSFPVPGPASRGAQAPAKTSAFLLLGLQYVFADTLPVPLYVPAITLDGRNMWLRILCRVTLCICDYCGWPHYVAADTLPRHTMHLRLLWLAALCCCGYSAASHYASAITVAGRNMWLRILCRVALCIGDY